MCRADAEAAAAEAAEQTQERTLSGTCCMSVSAEYRGSYAASWQAPGDVLVLCLQHVSMSLYVQEGFVTCCLGKKSNLFLATRACGRCFRASPGQMSSWQRDLKLVNSYVALGPGKHGSELQIVALVRPQDSQLVPRPLLALQDTSDFKNAQRTRSTSSR